MIFEEEWLYDPKKNYIKKRQKCIKNCEICDHLEFKTHYFAQKTKLSKKLGQLDEKTAKMVIYMRHSLKKHFSKSKSHSLIEAHDQTILLAQKK